MSTSKPRITLTLEPGVYEVVRRLSAASGDSMSAVITDFLDLAVPQMQRIALVLEHAKAIPSETKEELRASLARSEARLLSSVADALAQGDELIEELAEAAKTAGASAAEARARRTASAASSASPDGSTPVPLTGGSGRVGKPVKTVNTASGKGGRRGRL
jgi:hypothetical protein